MNQAIQKISVLSFLLLGVLQSAQADDIEITGPKISNINCGADSVDAIFTVKNTITNTGIILYPATIAYYDDFPSDLTIVQTGGLTTCPLDNKTALPPLASCNINVLIQPDECDNGDILGDISRTLVVGVSTRQIEAKSSFAFSYTKLGGAEGFAILGNGVANGGGGSVKANASVGYNTSGSFTITNGQLYASASDPTVVAAQNSFLALFNQFYAALQAGGCTGHGSFEPMERLNAATYCLTNVDGSKFIVNGPVNLTGAGDFIFFINDQSDHCFSNSSSFDKCNIEFLPNTQFNYFDGASAENVYWIIGNGATTYDTGAIVDGTFLASDGPIVSNPAGNVPAIINGRLWSNDSITLYGNTVSVP